MIKNDTTLSAWPHPLRVGNFTAAGGEMHFEVFDGCEHEWIANPGPQTDRAHEMVKAFIARQLQE